MKKPSKTIKVHTTFEVEDSWGGVHETDFTATVLIIPPQGKRADNELDCYGYADVRSCSPDPTLVLDDDGQERLFDELKELAYEAYDSGE